MTIHRAEIVEYDYDSGGIERTGERVDLNRLARGRLVWNRAVTGQAPYSHLLCWLPEEHVQDRAVWYHVLVQDDEDEP